MVASCFPAEGPAHTRLWVLAPCCLPITHHSPPDPASLLRNRCPTTLQDQLAKKKKKRSPGRMFRKAAEGIRHALDGAGGRQSETSSAAPSPVPPAPAGEGSDGEARGSWGGLKSKLSGLGRRASEQ